MIKLFVRQWLVWPSKRGQRMKEIVIALFVVLLLITQINQCMEDESLVTLNGNDCFISMKKAVASSIPFFENSDGLKNGNIFLVNTNKEQIDFLAIYAP